MDYLKGAYQAIVGSEGVDEEEPKRNATSTPVRKRLSVGSSQTPKDVTDTMKELNRRLKSFLKDIEDLQHINAKLESALERDGARQEADTAALKDRLTKEIEAMENTLEMLSRQINDARADQTVEKKRLTRLLKEAHDHHLEELARIEEDLRGRNAAEIRSLREGHEAEAERATARIQSALDAQLQIEAIKLEDLRKRQAANLETPGVAEQLAEVRRENSALLSELADKEHDYSEQLKKSINAMQHTEEEIRETKDECDELYSELESAEKSYQALNKEVEFYRQLVGRLGGSFGELNRPSKRARTSTSPSPSPSPSRRTPSRRESRRRGSIEMTLEDSKLALQKGEGDVLISAVDFAGENVTITNSGDKPAKIGGWTLKAEKAEVAFLFPPRTTIPAGGSIRVWSGKANESKAPSDDENLWWNARNNWSKQYETAILLNKKNHEVSEFQS